MSLIDVTDTPLPQLPPRRADSHKGDFGRALLIGGSRGMSGAIVLAGRATLRSGAGLVTLAVPRVVQDVVASLEPAYMTRGLVDDGMHIDRLSADEIVVLAESATTLALGPGLGRSAALTELVRHLFHQISRPMVVDADALFALASRPEAITLPGGPRILTPHPGEFGRLVGHAIDPEQRSHAVVEFAKRDATHQTVVVLKGHDTVISDGARLSINHTGNPGMATGGSGDVLTGVITALICQGLEPFDAARLGTHVHGLAGDLAAAELGQVSLTATDLIDYLPYAFQSLPN